MSFNTKATRYLGVYIDSGLQFRSQKEPHAGEGQKSGGQSMVSNSNERADTGTAKTDPDSGGAGSGFVCSQVMVE